MADDSLFGYLAGICFIMPFVMIVLGLAVSIGCAIAPIIKTFTHTAKTNKTEPKFK